MKNYKIPMVPGPVRVTPVAYRSLTSDFGAGYCEDEFFELYQTVGKKLGILLGTQSEVIIQSGEAMSILWGAIKSCVLPGEKVLAISTGFFGEGFADMARAIHADAQLVEFGYDETVHDLDRIESAIKTYQPKVITIVHCETPSGTLNPISEVGQLKKKYNVPIMIVDAVASVACTEIEGDKWNADIVMGGSQKGLSLPPTIGFCSVSEQAWDIIRKVDYAGYEAFWSYHNIPQKHDHPNTPDWPGIAALNDVLDDLMINEGLSNVFARHQVIAEFVRKSLTKIGYRLFPKPEAIQSPSVTAVYVPADRTFEAFDQQVRAFGMGIGGSYGKIAGKVFRLGHMGTQATMTNARSVIDVLRQVI